MQMLDPVWTITSFALTVLVLSFLLGDNPLFRLVSYLFVGVSAGFAAVMLVYQVILPRLVWPLLEGSPAERALAVVPLVLSVLLLARLVPRLAVVGSLPMGYLVGAGAAVMISGAVMGTLVRQTLSAIQVLDLSAADPYQIPILQFAEAAVMLTGTVGTLAYFQFTARAKPNQPAQRPAWVNGLARVGEVFIAITLGALFAGVYAAALSALIDRLEFVLQVIQGLIG
ncbi:MAG: hypothetical protein GYA48_07190 [Chloroflexi bacterium]|nr:hypothetical protein [Chloroflexota bacterium]